MTLYYRDDTVQVTSEFVRAAAGPVVTLVLHEEPDLAPLDLTSLTTDLLTTATNSTTSTNIWFIIRTFTHWRSHGFTTKW